MAEAATAGETEGDVPRRRVRMDYEDRRESILDAAEVLFLDRPYSQVSINDLAEAAGVARGLLHHYFDSKRDLFLEVVRRVARVPQVQAVPDVGTDGDAWARSVDAFLDLISEQSAHWLTAVSVGSAERDDEVAGILDDSREVLADQTIAVLGIAPADASPALRALVRGYGGLVEEITREWLERRRLTGKQARTVLYRALPLLLDQVLPEIEAQATGTSPRTQT